MSQDETELIRRAQRGDAEACAMLYDRHYDAVYRYCFFRVGEVEVAQDVAGEVFLRMVEKLHTYKVRGRPLLAWLYTIARNLCIDVHRRNGREKQLPLEDLGSVIDGGVDVVLHTDRRLRAECLSEAMEQLTEDQRRVILLKFMEGLSNRETARVLAKTEGAVKSLQHRALAALERVLKRERCYET
ncbi:MAG: RNA polymerase sigma factor [Anaerolineae bacterium]